MDERKNPRKALVGIQDLTVDYPKSPRMRFQRMNLRTSYVLSESKILLKRDQN